nr:unnamed protein product [Digitaria exilis]
MKIMELLIISKKTLRDAGVVGSARAAELYVPATFGTYYLGITFYNQVFDDAMQLSYVSVPDKHCFRS